jgi:hypothetical protein
VEEIHAAPDPLLTILVRAADKFEAEIGLTLYVSGIVVSGTLVSGRRFFGEMAELLASEGVSGWAEIFARTAGELFPERGTEPGDEEPTDLSAVYIHLREARVFTSGNDRPLPETLWRGRLSHVSGWSLGTMRVGNGT